MTGTQGMDRNVAGKTLNEVRRRARGVGENQPSRGLGDHGTEAISSAASLMENRGYHNQRADCICMFGASNRAIDSSMGQRLSPGSDSASPRSRTHRVAGGADAAGDQQQYHRPQIMTCCASSRGAQQGWQPRLMQAVTCPVGGRRTARFSLAHSASGRFRVVMKDVSGPPCGTGLIQASNWPANRVHECIFSRGGKGPRQSNTETALAQHRRWRPFWGAQ